MNFEAIVNANSIPIYNYMKHDACRKANQQTGRALELNKCDNIIVIDVDIKHELDEAVKQEIRETLKICSETFIFHVESKNSSCLAEPELMSFNEQMK